MVVTLGVLLALSGWGPGMLLSTLLHPEQPPTTQRPGPGGKSCRGKTWSRGVSEHAKALKCAGPGPAGSNLIPTELGSEPPLQSHILPNNLPHVLSGSSHERGLFPCFTVSLVTAGIEESCPFLTLFFVHPREELALAFWAPCER